MWLVNTYTLTLEEVTDPFSHNYAILSHTWDSDEITFQDIWSSERRSAERKIGHAKLAKTCEIARQRGLQYAWVDSCCIDKSSSAELSEAINSMFAWYQHSGLFARSPSEFSSCATITKLGIRHDTQQEFSLSNKGVRIQTKLYKHAENAHVMSLGLVLAAETPVCVSLTRTTDGFVRSEPWSLEYGQIVKNPDAIRDMFIIHVRKDVTPQEDSDLRRQMHRSFRIAFELPASLSLERVVPDPEYLWDSVHSIFLSIDPRKSSAAKLNITIRGTDGNFREEFSLVLIIGWMVSTEKPFAVLYGATESADSARESVRDVLPEDYPDLFGDEADLGNSPQDVFESSLSTILSTSRFQATEVHFINAKMMVLHRSVRKRSAYVARFHVKLETHCNDADVITYFVTLSGILSRVEGREAVSNAYSQALATSSSLEE
ncbi:Vegetative incompatibility protein HET-E-1 [Colletotrichum fructicola]|nr:Vegetative incompatibility protein HET-E-1 [Colletotrichum fructicola]KAF4928843.1 Vegetative incompatibility protein HET-E-1 [Colletotrichum fructicola]